MFIRLIALSLFALFLTACTTQPSSNPSPTPTAQPTETPAAVLPTQRGTLFSGSGNCAMCHTQMKDESGKDVSTDSFWRATMLANSARDPYWQATVRSEVLLAPALRETIEKKCATCHTPMAETTVAVEGGHPLLLDAGFLAPDHPLHPLAVDGISCTLCHQIEPDNFSQADSFSGGYQVDPDAVGERVAYGPYAIDAALGGQMQAVSGFAPRQSEHTGQAELCGTCHDLRTPYLDEQGQIAGEFPEQMIYSEWANSAYRDTQTCRNCHMPPAQGGVQIATTGGPQRSPFYQHIFVGGNAYMGQILQKNGAALNVTASLAHFEAIIAAARQQIETQTASLALEQASVKDGQLTAQVLIQSRVGHKFPAGFPSRRAWLHITVLDRDGKIAFESGAVAADGRIQGNDNDEDGTRFEPHYHEVTSPDQVQIYEAVMQDTTGNMTTVLLRAASYAKDNRLLPVGFDLSAANPEIAVYGTAAEDSDFTPGGDQLALKLNLGQAQGPFTLQVELLYQTIGYRWAENIRQQTSAEAQAFAAYYASIPNLPLVAARVEIEVNP